MASLSSPHFEAIEKIEPDLRDLLPAELYAEVYVAKWADQNPDIGNKAEWDKEDGKRLKPVFDHLAALQKILSDYTSSLITEKRPDRTERHIFKRNGALMFTDLAGFTKLMEANAEHGKTGAENLLKVLNGYFTDMIEVVTKAGGELLEFTGDALLILFPAPVNEDNREANENLKKAVAKAVRAGLRMQRAMKTYEKIETPRGVIGLQMRIGIHAGIFYSSDVGTPRRREHVLLGRNVQLAKKTESNGVNGQVNLSLDAYQHVNTVFKFVEGTPGYMLVLDNFSDEELGEYEIMAKSSTRRLASTMLLNKSFDGDTKADPPIPGTYKQILDLLDAIKELSSFIPNPVLNMLVESAAKRKISAEFPEPTIMFVNLIGLPEMIDKGCYNEDSILESFNETFARINAAVEKRGGVLKKVTYHLTGSDIVIYFGVPNLHSNDSLRAASAAVDIRNIIQNAKIPTLIPGKTDDDKSDKPKIYCQIGINQGPTFVAEIGAARGRREFNVLGDTVNTTARLMSRAAVNQIVISEAVKNEIEDKYECASLGDVALKGKGAKLSLYELINQKAKSDVKK